MPQFCDDCNREATVIQAGKHGPEMLCEVCLYLRKQREKEEDRAYTMRDEEVYTTPPDVDRIQPVAGAGLVQVAEVGLCSEDLARGVLYSCAVLEDCKLNPPCEVIYLRQRVAFTYVNLHGESRNLVRVDGIIGFYKESHA